MVAIKVGPPTEEAVKSGYNYVTMVAYQKNVIAMLDLIWKKNPVGKVILSFVLKNPKLVSIEPLYKSIAAGAGVGPDNASTHPVSATDSAPKGVSDRGPEYWYAGKPDSIYTRDKDEREDTIPGLVGTGVGSDVVVNFTPEQITGQRIWDRRADNVLIHEIVHALRVMQGLRNPIPTKNSDWMNEEEFLACVVQDVYLSATGSTRLRYGYGDYEGLLQSPLNTSAGFVKEYHELFKKHAPTWGRVFTDLAMINTASFNPFRQFVAEQL